MSGRAAARALAALQRAAVVAASALPEEHVLSTLAACACEGSNADFCALYLAAGQHAVMRGGWRLGGVYGADRQALETVPASYGEGTGLLTPLFQGGAEVFEEDLLSGAPATAPLPPHFPARSLDGIPLRRRDGRVVGALLAASARPRAFDGEAQAFLRSIAHLASVSMDNARLLAAQQREKRMAAESAVTLGTVLESVGSGICVVDLDGVIRLANRSLQELFGLSGRVTGLVQEAVMEQATARPREMAAFLARTRELVADPSIVDESEWELETDPPRIVQRHAAPMRNLLGEVVGRVEVFTDVTEGRRLYTQLLHSERLRAIGEMVSGIAHDFNNLLASIVGQTELLHPEDQSPATAQAIATIRQAALDGARLIRNMRDYARARVEQTSASADLNETVQAAVEMAKPRWAGAAVRGGGSIDVRLDLGPAGGPGPTVALDAADLREVLLNLLFNAVDAMPEGGRIVVRTRVQRPGWAELTVRDTGHGMPEEVRERIFEPFFTTKGARGSGLGLAVTFSIISRLGGEIDVESHVGRGTTFLIRLPLAERRQDRSPEEAPRPAAPATASRRLAGARLLVVDDEARLLGVVRQLLERSGAQVTTAEGGRAALAILADPSAGLDAVLTDLDMPDVDGWAVAAMVREKRPDVPVVMLTGWAGEIPPEEFARRGVSAVLAKPTRRADLESTLVELLARRPLAPRPSARRVLLVEDDPIFAASLRDLLGLHGHTVSVATSGEEALAALEAGGFDVLLTDYRLGDMSGADLARRLAEERGAPAVVLITGFATCVDDPELLGPGIAAVLPKPCRSEEMLAVLARTAPRRDPVPATCP